MRQVLCVAALLVGALDCVPQAVIRQIQPAPLSRIASTDLVAYVRLKRLSTHRIPDALDRAGARSSALARRTPGSEL